MALVLATVAQLRNRLQDQSLDADVAQQAIDSAVSTLRGVWGQDIEFVADDTVVLSGGEQELVLPQAPLVVDSGHPLTVVELVEPTDSGVVAVEGVAFRRSGSRLIKPRGGRTAVQVTDRHGVPVIYPLGVWAPWVRVTYSHGYQSEADLPAGLTDIVLDAAAVYATNPTGLRSIALDGEVTLTYATEQLNAPRGLHADIRRRLRGIGARRGTVFSI